MRVEPSIRWGDKKIVNQRKIKKNCALSYPKKGYSVSCYLSAAPAPGQSADPGTRLTLTEKDQSIPA